MGRTSVFALASLVVGMVSAKQCTNLTIPVDVSARNGIFNLAVPETNQEATIFAQNFTSIRDGANLTASSLLGYNTTTGSFNISAKFCTPDNDNSTDPTVQFLTHGIGFDKTYWDLAFNDFNYSYIDVAVDTFGFCTLSIDRLGIGNSSTGDPLSVIQAPAELSAIAQISMMLRAGTLPTVSHAFTKIVHVGHSFGSGLSYTLGAMYPNLTDGLILTGFSQNSSFAPVTIGSFDVKLARLNQPLRFGNVTLPAVQQVIMSMTGDAKLNSSSALQTASELNVTMPEVEQVLFTTGLGDLIAGYDAMPPMVPMDLPSGYLTWADAGAAQFNFFYPPYFDPEILTYAESHKFPFTIGEFLTLGSAPKTAPTFTGPVQIVTGGL
ncbi:MAG: hypothetical protein M1835_007152 [Candelina submexicana]|nr:MAG: hypothetical protein M1835_007152 [Candelina submexicana]